MVYKRVIRNFVEKKLKSVDIHLNGHRPWDIQVHDDRFFQKVLTHGSLGLGESYMDGWIEVKELDESIKRLVDSSIKGHYNSSWTSLLGRLASSIMNKKTGNPESRAGRERYDLSHELFKCMLDKRMTYSCAYWKEAKNLDDAQEAKLDLICRKLGLQQGMKVLDMGSGWGSFAKFAAEKYKVQVIGMTTSKEHMNMARQICKGLPVEIRYQDYREIDELFDRIVSVGHMEHVGYKNYQSYMRVLSKALKDDGLFLLHTIGSNQSFRSGDPWIEKYIFPSGTLPSIAQIGKAIEGHFVMEDWHNFSADYDRTLMAWWRNFEHHWKDLQQSYDDRFYRMWKYYLQTCAGSFRARHLQLWQVVLSKQGVPGGYQSQR